MKIRKLLFKGLLFGAVILAGLGVFYNQPKKVEAREEQRIEKVMIQEEQVVDMAKIQLEKDVANAKNFIESVNSKIELKLVNIENGVYTVTVDKNPNQSKFKEYFTDSKVSIQLKYRTSLDMPVEYIQMNADESNGMLYINYRMDDIKATGINIDSYAVDDSQKAVFGKEWTKQEVLAVIENASDSIVRDINSNNQLKLEAKNSLERYLKGMAKTMGVKSVCFNNEYVETLNISNFQQGK
ncbi:MAG: DUF4230 domain-containing protein [Sarcina sp.]